MFGVMAAMNGCSAEATTSILGRSVISTYGDDWNAASYARLWALLAYLWSPVVISL